MIISHKHKFIFIKLRKTAGTSLEIALSGICGEDDIISPISKSDEEVRSALGHRGTQNIRVDQKYYTAGDWLKRVFKGNQPLFYNHMPAREIRARISDDVWNNYYRFCFERNPWDKVISHYYHRSRNGKYDSIMDYLKKDRGDAIRAYDMYTENDKILVHRIFRYEEMDDALTELSKTLGLSEVLRLPEYRAKSQFRPDRRNYKEVLTEEEASLIAARYDREIKILGYSY